MKATFGSLLVFGLLWCIPVSSVSAGYTWHFNNVTNKYYALTNSGNGVTWHDVRQEALNLGADLVVIDDAAENTWLVNTMFSSPDYQDLPGPDAIPHLWIGLYQLNSLDPDTDKASGWQWVDGSPHNVSDGFWSSGEPSDGLGVEDWAALKSDGQWNDYEPFVWLENHGYDGIQGIIESNRIIQTPVPSAALIAAIGAACVRGMRRRILNRIGN